MSESPTAQGFEVVANRHKSAGLAFALSLLFPGGGQLYCGKTLRGASTLVAFIVGIAICFSGARGFADFGIVLAFVVWIFAFVDAYFLADEINAGIDETLDGHSPRVAATLNLLTNGWGYFYLDEQGKGIALMLVLNIARFSFPSHRGWLSVVAQAAFLVIALVMAADAYRIARRELQTWPNNVPIGRPARLLGQSRLPAFVPVGLAFLLGGGAVLLVVAGLVAMAVVPR